MINNQHHERLQNAAIFGGVFTLLGYALPMLIYLVIPSSWFFSVEQPVSTDKPEYNTCEPIQLIIERSSRIETQAESTLELTLVLEGAERDVAHRKQDVNIAMGEKRVVSQWQVPCDAPVGNYYITGNMHFQVQNLQKDYQFKTQYFKVAKQ